MSRVRVEGGEPCAVGGKGDRVSICRHTCIFQSGMQSHNHADSCRATPLASIIPHITLFSLLHPTFDQRNDASIYPGVRPSMREPSTRGLFFMSFSAEILDAVSGTLRGMAGCCCELCITMSCMSLSQA